MNISEKEKLDIIYYVGEIEYRLLDGSDPIIQLSALLAYIGLKGLQSRK
jgi:DNA polymerase III delta prime subunit